MASGRQGLKIAVLVLLAEIRLSYTATVPLRKHVTYHTVDAFTSPTTEPYFKQRTHSTTNETIKVSSNETDIKEDNQTEITRNRLHRIHHVGEGIHLLSLNFEHVKYPLVFTLVVIFAGLSKIVFHHLHLLSSKVPESCCLIVIGLVWGCIIYMSGVGDSLDFFSPDEFFFFLLPPIILESAFSLHDRTFAENIGSVLLFAVLGTILACFSVGMTLFGLYKVGAMEDINCTFVQILVFSSLIVAVDPVAVLAVFQEVGVNNVLYFLVFGESLLNDGVTVVLYHVMQKLNRMDEITPVQIVLGFGKFFVVVICGLSIGVFCGILSSIITRFSNAVKVVEPLLIFGFAYLSYVLSELFEVSGIISMIACGIVQAHYSFHNITTKSRSAVKFFAKVMSTTCEIIIFLFLGLITWKSFHVWVTWFTIWTLVLCIVYRFIITFSLSCLINKLDTDRVRRIKYDEMFMMSYGGLRGAVCFSLVALLDESEYPMKNMFVTTALFVIFFTVFIQGGTVKWLVQLLSVKLEEQTKYISLNQELTVHANKMQRQKRVKPQITSRSLEDLNPYKYCTLEFIDTYIGYGVFAKETIHKGELILEYKGTLSCADKCRDENSWRFYFKHDNQTFCVDATETDCIGKMVNDELPREAKCKMKKLIVDGKPRLCLFSQRNIAIGEQLNYDYGVSDLPWRKLKVTDHLLAGIESIIGQAGIHYFKEQMNLIDDTYIRPTLQRNATKSDLGDITCHYEKLLMKEHFKHLEISGAKLPQIKTEIHHLDSKAALENLETKEEMEFLPVKDKKIALQKAKGHALWRKAVSKVQVINTIDEIPTDKRQVQKLVRKNIERSKQRPERLVFRVNSIRDRKGSFINHMRQKYKKNEQLGQMRYTVDMNRTRHSSQNSLAVPEPSTSGYDYPTNDGGSNCGITITVENVDEEDGEELASGTGDTEHSSIEPDIQDPFIDF